MAVIFVASTTFLGGAYDLTVSPQLVLTNSSTYTAASPLLDVEAEEVSGSGYSRASLTVKSNTEQADGSFRLIYNLATFSASGGDIVFDRVALFADSEYMGYFNYGLTTIADGTSLPFRAVSIGRTDAQTLVNGADGIGVSQLATSSFTQPSVGATVSVPVQSNAPYPVGSNVFFTDGTNIGWYEVTAITGTTSFTLENLGYVGSASPATTMLSGGTFVPSGVAGADGFAGFGLRFTYSSTTTGPAGAGELRFDNASPGSATNIYIDAEDRNAVDVSPISSGLNAGSSILVLDESDSNTWALFTLGSVTDNGTDLTLGVTAIGANGTFSGNVSLTFVNKGDAGANGLDGLGFTGGSYDAGTGVVTFTSDDGLGFVTGDLRGATGSTGPAGADGTTGFGLRFTFSATTTGPAGAGELRFNNASPGSATEIYIDAEDRNAVDVSGITSALNAGSSILVLDESDPAVWALFTLSSVTDNGTDLTLVVAAVGAAGTFAGDVLLTFANKGDTGATGATGGVSAATTLTFTETTEPSTPSVNDLVLYVDTADGLLKQKTDAGVVSTVGAGGGASITDIWLYGGF